MISNNIKGIITTFSAVVLWAFGVIYWPLLSYLDALTILSQRMLWSTIFVFCILFFTKKLHLFFHIFKDSKQLILLFCSAIALASNWFLFLWTVNNNLAIEASLGYFICPIMNIFFAAIFLKEKLSSAQLLALIIFCLAVLYGIISYGDFPIYALLIGITFSLYVFLHKIISTDPILAFCMETTWITPFCLLWLFYSLPDSFGIFGYGTMHYFLLVGTIFFTGVPLILFTIGIKNLPLVTVSFLQYSNPCVMLLLTVFVLKEEVKPTDYVIFPLIWLALLIVLLDSYKSYKKITKINATVK